jgi:hypothetical protein
MSEKLGCLEWWWLGGSYSPNHQFNRWGGCLSMAAPDSPVCQPRHPTVRVLTVPTVGALTSCRTGQSGAAPDRCCSLSGAPLTPALTSTRTVHALFTLWQTTVALLAVAPLGALDSPVAHRTVRWIIAERRLRNPNVASLKGYGPGHRIVRCARPGFSLVSFAFFFWTLTLIFLLVCVEPLAHVEHII